MACFVTNLLPAANWSPVINSSDWLLPASILTKGSSFPAPFFNCLIQDWIDYWLWCLHCSKYEFWAARNSTCLSFSFLISGHLKKNHSAENEVLDYSQPGYLCGLQPTDHYLRPGLHQWTHSTALSLFWWPEQPILAENEWWVSFFESLAMHWRSSFKYPKSVHKCDIR